MSTDCDCCPPAVNKALAGDTVKIQFSLWGDQGMDVLSAGSPTSASHSCGSDGGTPEAAAAGKKGFTYDPKNDVYTYWWTTSGAWKKTCRTFALALADGTTHYAEFLFN